MLLYVHRNHISRTIRDGDYLFMLEVRLKDLSVLEARLKNLSILEARLKDLSKMPE